MIAIMMMILFDEMMEMRREIIIHSILVFVPFKALIDMTRFQPLYSNLTITCFHIFHSFGTQLKNSSVRQCSEHELTVEKPEERWLWTCKRQPFSGLVQVMELEEMERTRKHVSCKLVQVVVSDLISSLHPWKKDWWSDSWRLSRLNERIGMKI